jgi:hypothetical protein
MTSRLSLLHSTSVEYFIGQLKLSSSVLFFLASNVTAPFQAKTWFGLVNRAEEDFSGRHLFFGMRVDSRLVGLFLEECGVNMCPGNNNNNKHAYAGIPMIVLHI